VEEAEETEGNNWRKAARAGLSIAGGAIPFVGGLLSAGAGFWSEAEQEHANKIFR
jgi:hypothetical protein